MIKIIFQFPDNKKPELEKQIEIDINNETRKQMPSNIFGVYDVTFRGKAMKDDSYAWETFPPLRLKESASLILSQIISNSLRKFSI